MSITIKDYRELPARFASVCACGHHISPGEIVGWTRYRKGEAMCNACWTKWKYEARSEDETGYY